MALPTFGAFMREAAGRYVAMDGRLWRTLAVLVGRPGYLTREYFAGRRKRYIRPARLFLVLYLLLFAVIGLIQSPLDLKDEVVMVDPDPAATDPTLKGRKGPKVAIVDTEDGDTLFGLDKDLNLALRWNGQDIPVPPQVAKRWDHFRNLSKDEKAERLYAGVLRYGPYAMVALMPAFALLMKIAYLGRGKKYPGRPQRYAEHLVYSAHLHAFAAIMILLFLLVPFGLARWALVIWVVLLRDARAAGRVSRALVGRARARDGRRDVLYAADGCGHHGTSRRRHHATVISAGKTGRRASPQRCCACVILE